MIRTEPKPDEPVSRDRRSTAPTTNEKEGRDIDMALQVAAEHKAQREADDAAPSKTVLDFAPATLLQFDYGALSPDQASEAKAAAVYIGERRQATTRAILEIGAKLLEIKASLGHGHFLPWLEAECGWSERSAQNYMQAAKALGSKSETVADLPVSTVYELAKAPEPVRDRVIEHMQAERLPAEKVRDLISEEKDREKKALADAKKTPEQRKRDKERAAREKEEHARHMAKVEAEFAKREAAAKKVAVMVMERFAEDEIPALLAAVDEAGLHELRHWMRWNGSDQIRETR